MSNNVDLDLGFNPPKGVKEVERSLDELIKSVDKFSNDIARLAKGNSSSIETMFANLVKAQGGMRSAISDSYKVAFDEMQKGGDTQLGLIRGQTAGIQRLYETRLATLGTLGNRELEFWKSLGARLGGIQKAQLAGVDFSAFTPSKAEMVKNLEALNSYGKELDAKITSLYDTTSGLRGKDSDAKKQIHAEILNVKSIREDVNKQVAEIEAVLREAKTKVDAAKSNIWNKAGSLATPDTGFRLLATTIKTEGTEVLAAINKFYSDLEATEARKASIRARLSKFNPEPVESSASVLKRMKEFYSAQEDPKGTFYKSQLSFKSSDGTFGLPVNSSIDPVHPNATPKTHALSSALKSLGNNLTDVHSLARGLASGFNLLWLTWGSMTPLLAGAAISGSFVKAVKEGKAVAESMADIQHLAGASIADMEAMSAAMTKFAETGAYGPVQTAKALQVLSLAGLDAKQSIMALKPALDFAATGGMDVEKSAESLIAVSTAYGYSASGMSTVADIIAKTAAMSMASVSGMTESFRVASVVAQQFGVTLEDSALNLAFLSQIGIKGSAAGTAMTNFYTQLISGSGPAKKALKELHLEALDPLTGKAKAMTTIIGELDIALRKKTATAQQDYIQSISSNRGSKDIAAALVAYRTKVEELDPSIQKSIETLRRQGNEQAAVRLETERSITVFKKYQEALRDAPGFSAIAAAGKSYTPDKLMAGVGSSLSSALNEAFKGSEDTLTLVAVKLKETFNSTEFKTIVSGMVSAVSSFVEALGKSVEWLVKHKDAISNVVTEGAKLAASIAAGVAAAAAWGGAIVVFEAVTSAVALMTMGYGALESALLAVNVAFSLTPMGLAKTVVGVLAAAGAYLLLRDNTTEAEKAAKKHQETEEAAAKANAARTRIFSDSLAKTIQNYRDMAEARKTKTTVEEVAAKREAEFAHKAIDKDAEVTAAVIAAEKAKVQARLTTLEAYGAANGIEGDLARKGLQNFAQQEQDLVRITASRHSALNQQIEEVKRLAAAEKKYQDSIAKNPPTGSEGKPEKDKAIKGQGALESLIASVEKFNSVTDSMNESSKKATEYQTFEAASLATLHKITKEYAGDKKNLVKVEEEIATAVKRRKAADADVAGATIISNLRKLNDELDVQVDTHHKLTAAEKAEIDMQTKIANGTAELTYWEKEYAKTLLDRAKALEKVRALEGAVDKASTELSKATKETAIHTAAMRAEIAAQATMENLRAAAMAKGPQYVAQLEAETAVHTKNEGAIAKLAEKIKDLEVEESKLKEKGGVLTEEQLSTLSKARIELGELRLLVEETAIAAGELAKQKWLTIDRDRIAGDLASALMTGFTEGGDAAIRHLRDAITKEFLLNPIELRLKAVISDILGGSGSTGEGLSAVSGLSSLSNLLGPLTNLGGMFESFATSGIGSTLGLSTATPLVKAFNAGSLSAAAFEKAAISGATTVNTMGTAATTVTNGLNSVSSFINSIPGWGWAAMALATQLGGPQIDKLGSGIQGTLGGNKSSLSTYDVYKEDHHGLFGIGAFTTENRGNWREADGATKYVNSIIGAVNTSVKKYAEVLGLPVDAIDGYTKQIDISLAGLDAAGQKAAIDKAISSFADSMVSDTFGQAVLSFAQNGETASTTLQRVATEFTTVNDALSSFGYAIFEVSTAGIQAAESLITAMGGISNFQSNMQAVYQGYYTQVEQTSNAIAAVIKGLGTVGINVSDRQLSSREEIRSLLDTYSKGVGTAEGDKQYAAVVSAAIAMDKLLPKLDDMASNSTAVSNALHSLSTSTNTTSSGLRSVGNASFNLVYTLEAAASRATSLFANIGSMLSGLDGGDTTDSGSSGGGGGGGGGASAAQNALADAGKAIREFIKEITDGTVEQLKNSRVSRLLVEAQYKSDLAKAQQGDLEASQNIVKSGRAYLDSQIAHSATAVDARRAAQLMANELRGLPATSATSGESSSNSSGGALTRALNTLTTAIKNLLVDLKSLTQAINESELTVTTRDLLLAAAEALWTALNAVKNSNVSAEIKLSATEALQELAKTLTIGVKATYLDDELKGFLGLVGKDIAQAVEVTITSAHGEASIADAITLLKTATHTMSLIVNTEDMDPVVRRLALADVDGIAVAVKVAMSTPGMSADDIAKVTTLLTAVDKIVNIVIKSDMPNELKILALGSADVITKIVSLTVKNFTGADKQLLLDSAAAITKNLEIAVTSKDKLAIKLLNEEALSLEAILNMSNGKMSEEVKEILTSGDLSKLIYLEVQMKAEKLGIQLDAISNAYKLEMDLSVGNTTDITNAVAELSTISIVTLKAVLDPGNSVAELQALAAQQDVVYKAHLDAGDTPTQLAELTKAQDVTLTAMLEVAAATDAKNLLTTAAGIALTANLDTTTAEALKAVLVAHQDVYLTSKLDTVEATAAKQKILDKAVAELTASLSVTEATDLKNQLTKSEVIKLTAELGDAGALSAKDELTEAATVAIDAAMSTEAATEAKDTLTKDATVNVTAQLVGGAAYQSALAQLTQPVTQQISVVTTNTVNTVVGTTTGNVSASNVSPYDASLAKVLPSAHGNIFVPSSLTAFALGGLPTNRVINNPLLFDMGIAGEAGPEAIMPLKRGPDGNLGVRASFGNPGQVPQVDYSRYNSGNNDALVAEVKALREDNKQMRYELQAIASHTSKTTRLLDRAMPDGDAIATRTAV